MWARIRILVGLTLALAGSGAAEVRRYIVELQTAPAIVAAGRGRTAMEQRRAAVRSRQAEAARALRGTGARVLGGVDTVANALFVELEEARANDVRALPGVARITAVVEYRARLDRALALSKVVEAWEKIGGVEKAGAGVKIAILDSGIDVTHPGFADAGWVAPAGFPRTSSQANQSHVNNKVIVARSYENLSASEAYGVDAGDGNGHGTAAAMAAAGVRFETPMGPVLGVAPMAYLGNYKVLGNHGGGGNDLILKGIEDAFEDGMDVLNLSLGSDAVPDPDQDPLVAALERVVAAGRLVLVAAGNSGPDPNSIGSPATAPNVVAVGSSSSDREFIGGQSSPIDPSRISGFSSRGPNPGRGLKPDLVATGDHLVTAQSQAADRTVNYKVTQGTSFATPLVAGAAAVLMAARPGLGEPAYRSLVVNSATPLAAGDGSMPGIRSQGAGLLNLVNALTSTITAHPVSLKFGVGGGTASRTMALNLTNVGPLADTFHIRIAAVDGREAPRVEPAEVRLEAGASATVNVLWEGSGLTGEYQGYAVVEAAQGKARALVPYWYAVESTAAAWISLLEPPASGTAGKEVTVLARVVDASGVAIPEAPLEVLPAGVVERDAAYPGLIVITVKLGPGENLFELRSGPVSRKLAIDGQ